MPERGCPLSLNPTSACKRDLLPLPRAIRSRTAIDEQKILHRVVGDKQIHAAVVVDVGRDHAQAFAQGFAMSVPLPTSVNVPSPLL